MTTDAALRRTPLYPEHRQLGARMVPFAGYEMPIQYAGIVAGAAGHHTTCGGGRAHPGRTARAVGWHLDHNSRVPLMTSAKLQ